MSILSKIGADLGALFFPPVCPVCGEVMGEGARSVCTRCRSRAPLTGFWHEADNPVVRKFWGVLPVHHASAFLFYTEGSGWRRLIHAFKYRGAWRLARDMGAWYGSYLADSGWYADVDVVLPVPLHPFKRIGRGYNQAEYLAEGIAGALGIDVARRGVVRLRNNPSQALGPKSGRWENVRNLFAVRRPELFAGRHVLLVDDVLTTGATVASCAEALLRAVPDCRISVAALAFPPHETETGR